MTWALDAIELRSERVWVRNYDSTDLPRIAKALHEPEGWFGRHWHYNTPQKIQGMLEILIEKHKDGVHNALVYLVGDEVAGITRLQKIEPAHRSLEIGGTWVAARWQKSFVNTEVKFLLLRHCFETLHAERVEFKVDGRNIESQRAVLRIGAKLEGTVRARQIYPDGVARDGYLFSVVRPEWEAVKANLQRRMFDPNFNENPQQTMPVRVETARLVARRYNSGDADSVFGLVEKNRAELQESFPSVFKELGNSQQAESYILKRLHQWHTKTFFSYAIFEKQSGQQIGQVSIKNLNWRIPSAELSYFVDLDHRGKGYATEILAKVVDVCHREKGMCRISLRILPTNKASLRVAEKLRFSYEGLHRNEFISGSGELVDVCYYSSLAHGIRE